MDLNHDLLKTVISNLGQESIKIIYSNLLREGDYKAKYSNYLHGTSPRYAPLDRIQEDTSRKRGQFVVYSKRLSNSQNFLAKEMSPFREEIKLIFKGTLSLFLSLLFFIGGAFIAKILNSDLFVLISNIIGAFWGIFALYYLVRFLINKTYKQLEKNFNLITPKQVERTSKIEDEVYSIINNSYETLSEFRKERERQARNSYNVALSLIIAGIAIVFFGVFLLFKKSIAEGTITSSVGAISNILGSTIIKFYRDTNNRMDKLNSDLFVLNTTKVRYAMILKISDKNKRDGELSNLISSIANIKEN